MTPFFVIFLLLALFSLADIVHIRKEQRLVLLLLGGLVLIGFAGLRYGDHDYIPYQMIFNDAQGFNLQANDDVGFSFLNALLGLIWNDPLIVFLTVALLSVSINLKCFEDYGRYALVALLFYFVHNYVLKEMIQIRAGLACAIGLWNVRNMQKGRYTKFLLFQLLAMSLHLGSIMFLIAWLVKQLKITRKGWIYILIGCFCIGMVYPFGAILKALPGVDFLARVQTYSEWGEYAESLGILTNMATLKQLFMSVVLLYFYNQIKPEIKFFDILMAMYFASTCWLMVWNDFAIVGARMATFLSIGEPILMSGLLYTVTPRSRPALMVGLVAVALVFLLINMQGKILPYQFYPTL